MTLNITCGGTQSDRGGFLVSERTTSVAESERERERGQEGDEEEEEAAAVASGSTHLARPSRNTPSPAATSQTPTKDCTVTLRCGGGGGFSICFRHRAKGWDSGPLPPARIQEHFAGCDRKLLLGTGRHLLLSGEETVVPLLSSPAPAQSCVAMIYGASARLS